MPCLWGAGGPAGHHRSPRLTPMSGFEMDSPATRLLEENGSPPPHEREAPRQRPPPPPHAPCGGGRARNVPIGTARHRTAARSLHTLLRRKPSPVDRKRTMPSPPMAAQVCQGSALPRRRASCAAHPDRTLTKPTPRSAGRCSAVAERRVLRCYGANGNVSSLRRDPATTSPATSPRGRQSVSPRRSWYRRFTPALQGCKQDVAPVAALRRTRWEDAPAARARTCRGALQSGGQCSRSASASRPCLHTVTSKHDLGHSPSLLPHKRICR
ncbi:hypothetical protein ABL78_8499 [Leptomonas seymouri]|uniref:Uncharacterized protein n=1 Tax=Leptomonas seymouri TaxID=5684 RepID=A0A0N1P8X3_LEPSE|nr:hypothetical protein ABL78_8499 [Leptomonas seymouri]|eukprot:KPI82491.1 hypothetical protein ABL78_8499 [Leptomonas seymouri]